MKHFCLRQIGAFAILSALLLPNAGALSGVSAWAEKDVSAAKKANLEPDSLISLSATAPITRAEFCAVSLKIYQNITGESVTLSNNKPFTDCNDEAVVTAYELGLVSGRGNGIFDPNAYIERQDLCKMLDNILTSLDIEAAQIAGEAAIEDFPDISSLKGYAYDATITMVDHSVIGGVANTQSGKTMLEPAGKATRQQALIVAGRFCSAFEDSYIPPEPEISIPEEKPSIPENITEIPSSTAEKMVFIYGEGGQKYLTKEEAERNMVDVAVKVWRLQDDGTKTSGTAYFKIHKNLKATIEKIFIEIYNGSEQFPIKNVGGYAWRASEEGNTKYEHPQGTAIDINWEENAYGSVNSSGVFIPSTGSYWRPGEDPYSISEDGDVVCAFAKYGFSWGGNAWSQWGGTRDYMHFSFFGG